VRHGELALVNLTPLMLAAPFGTPEMIRVLLDAGARVNDKDRRGMTPLMFAASSETQDAEVIKMLLAAGADTKVKTTEGETARDWALKFKNPAVLAELKKAGAPEGTPPPAAPAFGKPLPLVQAAARSVALLEKTGTEFFRQSGCAGCHHQNVITFALAAARNAGLAVNEPIAAQSAKASAAVMNPLVPMLLEKMDLPGGIDQAMSTVAGLAASGVKADDTVDSIVAYLASRQHSNGAWAQNANLASDAYATGLALFALNEKASANPKDAAYSRGVQYLLRTQLEDGSWFVRSRAPKFQPYFESGFPHGHDQWISATAKAYATMALASAIERKAVSGVD
jgi:hypothetical protein